MKSMCVSDEPIQIIDMSERSAWRCELFGCGNSIVLNPVKGKEPNWFWRWMQYLAFGNKWTKDGE